MESTIHGLRRWQFWLLSAVLLIALLFFAGASAIKCRCHESVWHQSKALAGMVLVLLMLLRLVVAAIFRDRYFKWYSFLAMTILAPLLIHFVFESVLKLHDVLVK